MIYRVGDGNNPAYDYSSQLKSVGNAESQEKFSLEHQKQEAASSKKEEKGEDKKLHEKPGAKIRQTGGVKLELSGTGSSAEETLDQTASQQKAEAAGGTLWDFVRTALQAVKDFFYKIWNDSPPEVLSEDVTPEEAERYTEEYYALKGIPRQETGQQKTAESVAGNPADVASETAEPKEPAVDPAKRDADIRKLLRSGNLEQVISLLTDDGKRSVAKNSTLLTYYDRNGKLTQINASDRERILHGDRHARKL